MTGSLLVFLSLLLVSTGARAQCTDEQPFEYDPIGATVELPPVTDTYWGCGPYPGRTIHYRNNLEYAANILADIAETYNTDNTPCWPVGSGEGYFSVGLFYPAAGGAPMFWEAPQMDPYSNRRTTSDGMIVEADLYPRDVGYLIRFASADGYADQIYWRKYLDCETSPLVGKNMAMQCPKLASSPAPLPFEGNPIGIGLGNKHQAETDIQAAGASKLGFTRYYNSHPFTRDAGLGAGWSHSYSASVWHMPNVDFAKVYRPNGQAYAYRQIGSQWLGDPDVVSTLTPILDLSGTQTGWRYVREDNVVEEFDVDGSLIGIEYLSGYRIEVAYNADVGIDTVADSYGRRLRFAYDQQDRIASITQEAGGVTQQYRYEYDGNENLVRVTYPDETPADDTDNPHREYLYEDSAFPHALTGIVDETGNRLATYAYDARGRAVMSTHAGDARRVDIAYDQPGGTVAVDTPKGTVRSYELEVQHGVVKPSGIARQ